MARYEMYIPGWRPALANELVGRHPMKVHKLKRRDADCLARARLVYRVPAATGRRSVAVRISGRYRRFPDDDAPWKSLLDALVTSGLLLDDARRYATWGRPEYVRGPIGTTVILQDEEEGAC